MQQRRQQKKKKAFDNPNLETSRCRRGAYQMCTADTVSQDIHTAEYQRYMGSGIYLLSIGSAQPVPGDTQLA